MQKPKPGENENLQFYYSRENRLKRAPAEVSWMIAARNRKKTGFLGALTANRALSSLFAAIIVICVLSFGYSFLSTGGKKEEVSLSGNSYSAQAFVFRDEVLISVKKVRKEGEAEISGGVKLSFELDSGPVSVLDEILEEAAEQVFRFSMPNPGTPKILKVRIATGKGKTEIRTEVNPE